jgi:hypothetical protein
MKTTLFLLVAAAAIFIGCEKETIAPSNPAPTVATVTSTTKEAGKTKRLIYCETRDSRGRLTQSGSKCDGKGSDCSTRTHCSIRIRFDENPDEIIFEDMTRQEFVDMWNTEEGRLELMERGVYEVDIP